MTRWEPCFRCFGCPICRGSGGCLTPTTIRVRLRAISGPADSRQWHTLGCDSDASEPFPAGRGPRGAAPPATRQTSGVSQAPEVLFSPGGLDWGFVGKSSRRLVTGLSWRHCRSCTRQSAAFGGPRSGERGYGRSAAFGGPRSGERGYGQSAAFGDPRSGERGYDARGPINAPRNEYALGACQGITYRIGRGTDLQSVRVVADGLQIRPTMIRQLISCQRLTSESRCSRNPT